MSFNGADRKEQPVRHLAIGQPDHNEARYLGFTLGEDLDHAGDVSWIQSRRTGVVFDLVDQVAGQRRVADGPQFLERGKSGFRLDPGCRISEQLKGPRELKPDLGGQHRSVRLGEERQRRVELIDGTIGVADLNGNTPCSQARHRPYFVAVAGLVQFIQLLDHRTSSGQVATRQVNLDH